MAAATPLESKYPTKTASYSLAFFLFIGALMSHARAIHPGKTYLITRRTERRHCLFRPDSRINRFVLYALTISAIRHGILVHAFCAMSTHLHYVVTDPLGKLPEFFEMFHRLLTRGVKIIRQWDGSPWERVQTNVVELCTAEAIVEKIAYTLTNPVQAGLVHHAHQWPGAKTLANDIGRPPREVPLPNDYFDPKNPEWQQIAELKVHLPPGITESNAEAFRNAIKKEVRRLEKGVRQLIPKREVLGVARVMQVPPESRITSYEPKYQRIPTFAFGRKIPVKMRTDAIAKKKTFQRRYQEAWAKWRSGDRDVEFPAGTYAMRVKHNARIALED